MSINAFDIKTYFQQDITLTHSDAVKHTKVSWFQEGFLVSWFDSYIHLNLFHFCELCLEIQFNTCNIYHVGYQNQIIGSHNRIPTILCSLETLENVRVIQITGRETQQCKRRWICTFILTVRCVSPVSADVSSVMARKRKRQWQLFSLWPYQPLRSGCR